jgi:RHS repeat-associated protein
MTAWTTSLTSRPRRAKLAISTLAGNPVGDLEYSYDADGRVIEKTGSFAQTGLLQPVSGNTFNAANEMTAFNGTPQTYDPNGNVTNDGTNSYTWDARNHLTAIAGSNSASFAYDPLGRRDLKTINGVSTQFLYDGLNPVQEIQNGAPSANLITGLGIDEYFQRTDSAGARDYLSDILSSSLALADSTGTIQTQYSYDPFGNSGSTGSASANPYQFTGRENDGTGLDYYRARYYSPTLQRFVSQDPLYFGGGDFNLYSYVLDDPADLTDPSGETFLDCGEQIEHLLSAFEVFWKAYEEHQCATIPCKDDPLDHHKKLQQLANQLLKQAKTTGRACKSPIVDAIETLLEGAAAGARCVEEAGGGLSFPP